MSFSHNKGLEMEGFVDAALKELAAKFPTYFVYESQPAITTHTGYKYKPDFRVEVALSPFRLSFFIECQKRNRVGGDISEKIDSMRLRSEYNLFFFVYEGALPETRKQYMRDGGTTCLSLEEFIKLLAALAETLTVLRMASVPANGLMRLGFFGD